MELDKLTNNNIIGLKASATLAINEKSVALQEAGQDVIRLGFGQSPFPVPEIVITALKDNAHQKDYLPVRGLMKLREAVADYHQRKFYINCEAEDVLIGPGSKELLFLTQLIYAGTLVLPQPSWVSYAPQAQLSYKKHILLPTRREDHYMLHPDTLEEYCQMNGEGAKILLLNYPSNPTGATFSAERLAELASVASKYQVLLLSDEIYGDTHFSGHHQSIATYYPEGTIISSGLSKWCGAGGWRLGTFVFPRKLRWLQDKMAIVASETFTSTSAPIQYAAIAAYSDSEDISNYLTASRQVLKIIAQEVHRKLNAHHITCPPAAGGFYLMPDFSHYRSQLEASGITNSQELCNAILDSAKVALLPLSDFGMPPDYLGARLSYVDFNGEAAISMLSPKSTAQTLAPRVLQGIDRIIKWTKSL